MSSHFQLANLLGSARIELNRKKPSHCTQEDDAFCESRHTEFRSIPSKKPVRKRFDGLWGEQVLELNDPAFHPSQSSIGISYLG
jgi:hypothetical protein